MIRVLFVCHGNICRSTAAETIFLNKIKKAGIAGFFEVDSCAVSDEEEGNPMYPPMRRELTSRGIEIHPHYARQINQGDFSHFDFILYMDRSNARYLSYYDHKNAKVQPLTDYGDGIREIEDPWYSGRYALVVDQIDACLDGFLERLSALGEIR